MKLSALLSDLTAKRTIKLDPSVANENFIGGRDQNEAPVVCSRKNLQSALDAGIIGDNTDAIEATEDNSFVSKDGVTIFRTGKADNGVAALMGALK